MKSCIPYIAGLWLLSVITLSVQAQDTLVQQRVKKTRFKAEYSAEYLTPTHADRDIHTLSANVLAGVEFFPKCPFSIYGGITVTHARGTTVQDMQRYDELVNGAGPVFLLRFEPFVYKGFSIAAEVSSGIILYNRHFPAGGDIYNFMSRLGGSLLYRIDKRYGIAISGMWMHVSNGQGLNPHNPSYEAWGIQAGTFFTY